MNLRALIVASVLLPAGASFAAIGDPCTPDVVDPATGEVTSDNFVERCEGTQTVGCFAETQGGPTTETAQDCAALFDGAPVGTCEEYAGFGPRCAFADGDACVFSSATNPFIPFPCQNDTSGCINGNCVANAGACDAEAPASCLPGGEAGFCAPWSQLVANACEGWAALDQVDTGDATLSCSGEGVCGGVGDGGQCATGLYECAPGIDCVGESSSALGICGGDEPAEGEGEGEDDEGSEGEGEGRDGPPEDPPAAGCFNALGVIPAAGPLALALLALRRRRRA